MSEFLTPAEFAERIPLPGVKNKELFVKRRCRAREITHSRISRNIIAIPASEVDRWLARRTVESVTDVPAEVPAESPVLDIADAVRSHRKPRSA